MYRIEYKKINDLKMSSPRTLGYFHSNAKPRDSQEVFPAYAGVFLSAGVFPSAGDPGPATQEPDPVFGIGLLFFSLQIFLLMFF